LAAQLADRTVCIGRAPAKDSYLRHNAIVAAALGTHADAIHPGYGFLAEDASFADLCEQAGVTFVGPNSSMLRLFGDKVAAREAARRANVPMAEGSEPLTTSTSAVMTAEQVGYPVVLKAVSGGGGKGMRVARGAAELEGVFGGASQEALSAFGDGTLYLERWIPRARHVEVQVAGDGIDSYVHFGDRDCSVQRRHQKLVEEAPASGLSHELQNELRRAAVRLCQNVGYDSIGTVEFIVDPAGQFYFLEVNARLQVEHGVTELVTGRDLVHLQLRLAQGEPLALRQESVNLVGTAIECRINAEDPNLGFRPSPGLVTVWKPPEGQGVRVDSCCFPGYVIPPFYDSLVAKVMCHGPDRSVAIHRIHDALEAFVIGGISTTKELLYEVVGSATYRDGAVWTTWLEEAVEADPCNRKGITAFDD
jgi:acetyl-CoA carboxylase biotin carboxylase subunit